MELSISCRPETRQQKAMEDEDVTKLHSLLARYPQLLEEIDKKPFVHTPLHEAASAGKFHLAMELSTIKPSFAWKLNPEGLSPMHLALQNGHIEAVRALMIMDPELIRVKGRNRITPLHCAVEMERNDLLAEFLCACPKSIEDLTLRFETAVHIAVKNQNLKAFEVLFGWLKRVNMDEVLKWKDEEGDTALHLAVSTNQPKVVKMLIKEVNVNMTNSARKTALDIFEEQPYKNEEVKKLLHRAAAKRASSLPKSITPADYLTEKLTIIEVRDKILGVSNLISTDKKDTKTRDIILVIAILVVTAAYQAILSPPGGFSQDDNLTISRASTNSTTYVGRFHLAGQMVMHGLPLTCFMIANTWAFVLSVITILIMIAGLPSTKMVSLSIGFLSMNYFISMSYNLPDFSIIPAISIGLGIYVLVLVSYKTSLRSLKSHMLKCQIDTPKRRVGDFLNLI